MGLYPLESLAFYIPAVTTTLAGFGLWIKHHYEKLKEGLYIIDRNDSNALKVTDDVADCIRNFINIPDKDIAKIRDEAFNISRITLWKNLIEYYKQAYSFALYKAESRFDLYKGKQYKEHLEKLAFLKQPKAEWRKVLIYPEIPRSLANLQELAMNLWWSWNYEAIELFEMIDKDIWNDLNNPYAMLQYLTLEQLRELESNQDFLKKLKSVYDKFSKYMSKKPDPDDKLVAYFCMEYGLHNSLKIFSGGLGILAGDYLKEASDQNHNFVGVGFLYRYGYFNQRISLLGDQIADMLPQKFSHLPILAVRNEAGDWIKIGIAMPGRTLYAKIWRVNVGRIPLYLMDTDIDDNTPFDRGVTAQLYGGDWENRFKQELLLGVGGIRLLSELKIKPDLYHCNEGHGAFIGLERLRNFIQDHQYPYNEALEIVRASTFVLPHIHRFRLDMTLSAKTICVLMCPIMLKGLI